MTDDLFEQRLRRDLRRLADELVDGPGHGRPPGRTKTVGGRRRFTTALPPTVRRAMVGLWLVATLCLVAAGVVAGRVLQSRTTPLPRVAPVSALADVPGPLAYFAGQGLYTAEPGTDPHRVATTGNPGSAPQWSPDGDWLAYLGTGGHLHLVHGDGSDAHLALASPVTAMTWSPVANLLALVPSGGPDAGDLVLVSTGGGPAAGAAASAAPGAPTVVASAVTSFVWSSDGTRIAYSQGGAGSSPERIVVFDVVAGTRVVLPYRAPAGTGIQLASWWPDGGGLLFWLDPGRSVTAEATGLPLADLPLSATSATVLAKTFVYLPWLAWSPGGNRLLVVEMSGSMPWQGSRLAICRPARRSCQVLPQPAGTVTMDPAWSPSGHRIAFVRASVLASSSPGLTLDTWYGTRRLWVSNPDGGRAQLVSDAGAGVADPQFSPSGRAVVYVTAGSIESAALSGGRPTVIASGLAGALDTAGPDGYGKLPWGGTAAWGS